MYKDDDRICLEDLIDMYKKCIANENEKKCTFIANLYLESLYLVELQRKKKNIVKNYQDCINQRKPDCAQYGELYMKISEKID